MPVIALIYAVWCAMVLHEAPNQTYPSLGQAFTDDRFEHHHFLAQDDVRVPVALRIHDKAPVVLYFMGNAGSRALFGADIDPLLEQPVSLVLMAYRGGEGNGLTPSEAALKGDAQALYQQLPELLDYTPDEQHVIGYSMGSGIALDLAAREDLTSVMLLAPMPRLCAIIGKATATPYCLLPGADRWDNLALARQVEEPVLQIYGDQETLFPPATQEALAKRFPYPPQVVILAGRGHNDLAGAASDAATNWLTGGWRSGRSVAQ